MSELLKLETWITSNAVIVAVRIAILLLVGLPLLHCLALWCERLARRNYTAQSAMVARKAVYYVGVIVILITVMNQLGVKLTAVLGAAGVVGIAIGFAAQTSLSNIISGVFLVGEKPFQVGDLIKVGDKMGFVLSVDLLSVKLRTFDNTMVRIPNEQLIKTDVTNVTRFPIRRFDLRLTVAYKENISRVIELLAEIADKNPFCLDEPAPLILFDKFAESGAEILFGLWFAKDDFLTLRKVIMTEIKERFEAEGIAIALPHRVLVGQPSTIPSPPSPSS